MDELINQLIGFFKPFILLIITALISAVSPIGDVLVALFFAFLFNIFTGIVTDVHVNKKDFCIKKAFDAITQLLLYATLIVFVHFITTRLKDFSIGETGVKWITYIVVYYYLTNILRNAKKVFPKSSAILFMYDVMSTQVFTKLKEFIGMKSTNSDNCDKNNTQP